MREETEKPASTDLPRQVGRYVVTERLGRGGMGEVLAGHDETGRPVALKRLRPDLSAAVETRQRFRREARISARLQHPAIPAVYECGVTPGGDPYLLMRVIRGRSLEERLRDMGIREGEGA